MKKEKKPKKKKVKCSNASLSDDAPTPRPKLETMHIDEESTKTNDPGKSKETAP